MAILFGFALTPVGPNGQPVHQFSSVLAIFFAHDARPVKLAPIGAGGAMAFTIGRYGVDALQPLAALIGSFY